MSKAKQRKVSLYDLHKKGRAHAFNLGKQDYYEMKTLDNFNACANRRYYYYMSYRRGFLYEYYKHNSLLNHFVVSNKMVIFMVSFIITITLIKLI